MKPSLSTVVARAMRGETALNRGSTLLIAVSGGPDSIALLDVVARLAPKHGITVVAHGVDHGLRPEAPAELDLAAALARTLDVRFDRSRVKIAKGGNLQARARTARREALLAAARRCSATAIATAHHADDRAETLLLRLLRGAGPRGLAVLPPRTNVRGDDGSDVELVRPILRARRSDIEAHIARRRLEVARDPSNEDVRYARTRVRHELLPLLESLSPEIVRHLEALADRMHELRGDQEATGFPIPRATEAALRALATSRSKSARVWLPGGLVAMAEPPSFVRNHVRGAHESSESSLNNPESTSIAPRRRRIVTKTT